MPILSGRARIAGLIGWPVAHSRSPRLHNFWLERHRIDGAYVPLPVPPESLPAALRGLTAAGPALVLRADRRRNRYHARYRTASGGDRSAENGSEPYRDFQRLQRLRGSSDDEASSPYPAELRERTVRMVLDQRGEHGAEWTAIRSITEKIGCSGETLRSSVRQAECDRGVCAGRATEERERIKALEREAPESLQANEVLRMAAAYFAQAELDRRFRP